MTLTLTLTPTPTLTLTLTQTLTPTLTPTLTLTLRFAERKRAWEERWSWLTRLQLTSWRKEAASAGVGCMRVCAYVHARYACM